MNLPYLALIESEGININSKTTILIFARGAHFEASQKRFHSAFGKSANITLAGALNAATIDICNQTKLPYFFFDHTCQVGFTFETRLIHAFQQIFSKGYDNVIAIGNDCPDLKTDDLLLAHKSLEQGKVVLGPAGDGGVYLIGINRQVFSDEVLRGINWKTNSVFKELNSSIKYPIEVLDPKFDIDTPITQKIVQKTGGQLNRFWKLILIMLTHFEHKYEQVFIPVFLPRTKTLRGPPHSSINW